MPTKKLIKTISAQALILILSCSYISLFVQTTKCQSSLNGGATTSEKLTSGELSALHGLTDCVLIDGEIVLRILDRKGGAAEVRLQERDGEKALVFTVMRFTLQFGKLYVSKTHVAFDANEKSGKNFSIESGKLSEVKSQTKFLLLGMPNLALRGEGLKAAVTLPFYQSNPFQVEDKNALTAAVSFLARSIQNFDSALAEFNNLTAKTRELIEKEREESRMARIAAEERNKQAKVSLQERIAAAKAEEAIRSEYESKLQKALQDGQGQPLTQAIKSKVDIALKALRKMKASTDVGVTMSEYSSRLIDTKVDVDEAVEALPSGFLREELKLALQAFIDVGKAWQEMGKYNFLILMDDMSWVLIGRYGLRPVTRTSSEDSFLPRTDIQSTIWDIASKHLQNATVLSSK